MATILVIVHLNRYGCLCLLLHRRRLVLLSDRKSWLSQTVETPLLTHYVFLQHLHLARLIRNINQSINQSILHALN